jgi:hypothetical protein
MAQDMRRDALGRERWTLGSSHGDMLAEDILEACAGHRLLTRVDEEFWRLRLATHGEPGSQIRGGLLPER